MKKLILFVVFFLTGVAFGETTITVNGETVRTSGKQISVNGDLVIVDGKVLSGQIVEGSRRSIKESRELDAFSELELNIGADVTVSKGNELQCTITADGQYQFVITEVDAMLAEIDSDFVTYHELTHNGEFRKNAYRSASKQLLVYKEEALEKLNEEKQL